MTTASRPTSLAEVKEERDSLLYQAEKIYTEAGAAVAGQLDFSKVRCIDGTTDEKIAHWQKLQLRLKEVGADYDRLKRIEAEMAAVKREMDADNSAVNPAYGPNGVLNGGNGNKLWSPNLGMTLSIRKALDNSPELKALRERRQGTATIEISHADYKATVTLTGISPQNDRRPPIRMAQESRTVMDMIGESQASAAVVEWYRESTFTNTAAETAEEAAKPEAALAWTLENTPIRTVAVWIPVTVQALDDNDFLEAEIRNRLMFMVQRREETQVLIGNGTGQNIRGILNTTGVQTQAKGVDPIPTAILKGLQKVRGAGGSAFLEPDGIVMHPNDFTDMMSLQTTDGAYLLQAILQQEIDARLWGLPIRQTSAITENTTLVGAFAESAEVFRRMGITVAMSTEHSDYFTTNRVAIRAESRLGLAVQIPAGFCTVTGV